MYAKIHNENIFRKVKRRKLILLFIAIAISFILLLRTDLSPDLYFINFDPVDDISCHYTMTKDALEQLGEQFTPGPNSIFFHETSCHGGLNSRQACSVESAARAHPNREIYVLFSGPVNKISLEDVSMDLLKKFPNIKFRRVHIIEYAKGTPIEALVENGALNRTKWPVSHTADVLRFVTLFKWGGVVLDLDTVVARSLDTLPKNWAVREDDFYVTSSALAFSKDEIGRMIAYAALSDLNKNFRGDVRSQNGPLLITRVLKNVCSTNDAWTMSADTCKGFEVFGPELFRPVGPSHLQDFFKPGDLPGQNAYIYHIWNPQKGHLKVKRESPYAKLAKQHCPVVFETFGKYFGS